METSRRFPVGSTAIVFLLAGSPVSAYLEDLETQGLGKHSTFHYEFTRALARAAGFKSAEAEFIAVSCQATDSTDFTGETGTRIRIGGTGRLDEAEAKFWHFPRRGSDNVTGSYLHPGGRSSCEYFNSTDDPCPSGGPEVDEMEAWAVLGEGSPGVGTPTGAVDEAPFEPVSGRSLLALGIYLHGLADSYSHEKCMEQTGTRRHDTTPPIEPACTTKFWHLEAEYGVRGEGYPYTVEAGQAVWKALLWYRYRNQPKGLSAWSDEEAALFARDWAAQDEPEDRRTFAVEAWGSLNQELQYFPQFGDGAAGGATLNSRLAIVNPSATALEGVEVRFRTGNGDAMSLDIDGTVAEAAVTGLRIPGYGSRTLRTDGHGPLQVGSATVVSPGPVSAVVLFGGSVGLAGVASSEAGTCSLYPVENGSGESTGMALMSPGSAVNLELELRSGEGTLLAEASLSIPANGQTAVYVSEIPWIWQGAKADLGAFSGVVRVQGDAPFALVALLSSASEFATLPVSACQ